MAGSDSKDLLARVHEGDDDAAQELVDCYVQRLIELARSRLSQKLSRRVDPEDVVQSACRSFFRRAQAGEYQIEEGGDIWHLLVAITVNKVRNVARRHTAQKRSVQSEESAMRSSILDAASPEALSREPSPEEAVILVEATEQMMSSLSPLQRHILQLRLQGHSVEETAQQAECAERTVHRASELARRYLEKQLATGNGC